MLRVFVTALGACLVAFVTGMHDPAGEPSQHAQHEAFVSVTPAPETDRPPATGEPTVEFVLPGPEANGVRPPASPQEPAAEAVDKRDTIHAAPIADSGAAYRFPKREDWEDFSRRQNLALAEGSLEGLASLEPEARAALAALRAIPGQVDYADWLHERLQDIEIARVAAELNRSTLPAEPAAVPLYEVWLAAMHRRAAPARAQELVPQLKPIFIAAQLPPGLVWIAEAESSFNPAALSPAGARGLFQLMPDTAQELGLELAPVDERLDPFRNADSAARYLVHLHQRFRDWPLVLAAYNAGPTRVQRLLDQRAATTFAEIVDDLPTETQLFVPKVLATLAVREGLTPATLQEGEPAALATE